MIENELIENIDFLEFRWFQRFTLAKNTGNLEDMEEVAHMEVTLVLAVQFMALALRIVEQAGAQDT